MVISEMLEMDVGLVSPLLFVMLTEIPEVTDLTIEEFLSRVLVTRRVLAPRLLPTALLLVKDIGVDNEMELVLVSTTLASPEVYVS